MNELRRIVIGLVFACAATSCATQKKPEAAPKKSMNAPQLVGRVASIQREKKFLLIQSFGKWSVEIGQVLTSEGPEKRVANIVVTGETLGQFAAADLKSGSVEVGDSVFIQPATQVSAESISVAPVTPVPANP